MDSKSKKISNLAQEALLAKFKKDRATTADTGIKDKLEIKTIPISEKTDTNSVLYSELFNYPGIAGTNKDFYCPVYSDSSWEGEDKDYIPKEFEYYPDHKVLYPLVLGYVRNLKVLIVGPTGSGKTTLGKYMCSKFKQPYLRINGRADMESDSILGKLIARDGNITFDMGELPKAMLKGWFVAFDEPWKANSGIQMALQRLYERDGILQLDDMIGDLRDKQIRPDDKFRMILCDNVVGTGDGIGQYSATQIQDSSTIRRMNIVLYQGYLDQNTETQLLTNKYPSLHREEIVNMVKLANMIRYSFLKEEVSCVMDTGLLETWAELTALLGDIKESFTYVMLNRYNSDTEKSTISEFYRVVFGIVL